MIKCKFCGVENPDGTRFCSSCGAKTEAAPVVEAVTNNTTNKKVKKPIKGGILAWSIVNAVLGAAACCTLFPFASLVLGVIAIIFTVLAQNCQDEKDEKSKIKVAVILNIIASAIIVISMMLLIVLLFLESYMPYPYSEPLDLDSFMEMYPYMD